MALIFAVSSIENPPPPPAGLTDKREHLIEYAILSTLALRAFAGGRWAGVTVATALWAVLFSGAYGATDEWHQRFVPGRTSEAMDVVADVSGAALAGVAMWAWKRMKNEK